VALLDAQLDNKGTVFRHLQDLRRSAVYQKYR
jgi:hypothetical protein